MSDLIPELAHRKSKRALSSDPIPSDVVDRLIAAATSSASCFNNQPWRFVLVQDEPALSVVRRTLSGNNYWAEKAPLVVLVVTDLDWDCRVDGDRDYALFDTGMATGYLILQAVREGLVAHPIAGFRAPELKDAMGIPVHHVLVTCVVVGYPGDPAELTEMHRAAETAPRKRRNPAAVAFRNEWREEDADAPGN